MTGANAIAFGMLFGAALSSAVTGRSVGWAVIGLVVLLFFYGIIRDLVTPKRLR